jgi:hypothetical protein
MAASRLNERKVVAMDRMSTDKIRVKGSGCSNDMVWTQTSSSDYKICSKC